MGFAIWLAAAAMIAVEGLRRYGYNEDAERISMKFLSLVRREYLRQGYIVEKYDVVSGGSNVRGEHSLWLQRESGGFRLDKRGFSGLLIN